ncbi:glycosyltransferase family 2 protein [Methylobacterium sp. Leaf469]|uniref:glycosyltransferase family 2 protein n=1 Tax=Methylobacterium sp. Leaf469 TaxID=1736387 RepID=UPI0009EB2C9E|nr:glycosyltransferase family 2 protein [Methylobacterium sp. Leaf469]
MDLQRWTFHAWQRIRGFAARPRFHDTYQYLLERPEERHFDRCGSDLRHETPFFSKRVYENSRRKRFFSRRDAYRDWLAVGRTRGLEFGAGLNTYLKVVLKIKDDAYLLPKWMDYYSRLVGWHNIIVMDCGSRDEAYLSLLAEYRERVLLFSYPHYYDNLHDVAFNLNFYRFVSRSCKYLCVVDADEFVFGYRDGTIGGDNLLSILSEGDEPIYPGTWYQNIAAPAERSDDRAWQGPLRFDVSRDAIAAGTFNGKAIVRSNICPDLTHVGHNLHVGDVAARIRPDACGRIGVLHVSNLGSTQARMRVLRHLKAKGLVPSDMPSDSVADFLAEAIARGSIAQGDRHYADQFLRAGEVAAAPGPTFETDLIARSVRERNPDFQRQIEAFDFAALLPH